MKVVHIKSDRREEWNAFVAQEPSFALLQSWEWGEFKEKLGWKAFRIAVEQQGQIVAGAQVLIKSVPLGLASVAYIPRGPVGGWLDKETTPYLLSELHRVARNHRAIFLRIEPPLLNKPAINQVLQHHKFRASHHTNQPQATIILDLRPDLDVLLARMRKKTRQYIRQAPERGVTVRVGGPDDLPALYELMQITGQRNQFSPRSRDYYEYEWQTLADKDQTVLLLAYYQGQLLAVRTAYHFGNQAAEFHAGSLDGHADLRANYLLVWEAIKWAKAWGCCTYDLWGIPNEVGQAISEGEDLPAPDRSDGLWGVYRFKRGFGKNVVCYIGAYDYVYSPRMYILFTNKLFDGDMLDRIATRMDALRPV